MALGRQIKKQRERLGWTLEVLSDRSGVDVGTISALEVRDSQRTKYAAAIAAAFNLTMEELEDPSTDAAVLAQSRSGPPKRNSHWPFRTITEEQWLQLSADVRGDIEDYVQMKVTKANSPRGGQNKQAA